VSKNHIKSIEGMNYKILSLTLINFFHENIVVIVEL